MSKQNLDTSLIATFKNGTTKQYSSLEEASTDTGLSISSIKIRANKPGCGGKDKTTFTWCNEHTRKSFQAKKSRTKGKNYELQVIKELEQLGYSGLSSSRQSSRAWDNAKVDIYDSENVLDFYVQCKATANIPNISGINKDVGFKDKPLAIFWDKQNGSTIKEEFVIIPKDYFYKLIKNV